MAIDLRREIRTYLKGEVERWQAAASGRQISASDTRSDAIRLAHAKAKLKVVESGPEVFEEIVRIATGLWRISRASDGDPMTFRDPTLRRIFLDNAAEAYVVVHSITG